MKNLMQAVQITDFGDQHVLQVNTIEIPDIGDNDLLIKMHASSVNPVDWKIRQGYLQALLQHQLPLTLGWDVAGTVVKTGTHVTDFSEGDEVYSRPNIARQGSYAQYISVAAAEVALKPKTLSFKESAGIPLAGLTAWQSLFDLAKLQKGERVLIHAGSGAVGQFAIQLAKHQGAYVVTTTSAVNTQLVLSLGADQVIDYQQEDFSELRDLDVVFDTLGGDTLQKSYGTLKAGGRLVSVVEMPNIEHADRADITAEFCMVQPNAQQLKRIAELADAGQFKVIIDSEFSLEDIAKAHAKSETGRAKGKIIINMI